MNNTKHLTALWLDTIGSLLDTPEVRSMGKWRHHCALTCLEHSVFVSYIAFRIARNHGWDTRAAARAGLLHDLYLYDPKIYTSKEQCRNHPRAALRNARKLCGNLTPAEENAIISHMWPMADERPRTNIAVATILADKFCTAMEALCLFRARRVARFCPAVQY